MNLFYLATPVGKSGSGANSKSDVESLNATSLPLCLLGNEQWSPQGEGVLLDIVLDNVLSQLQPVCLAEQAFCTKFLHLDTFLTSTTKVLMLAGNVHTYSKFINIFCRQTINQ